MTDNPGVSIDTAHANLLFGLVCAHKPTSVLEFGFGGGVSAEAILRGIEFNQQACSFTIVDNWADWDGKTPRSAVDFFCDHPTVHFFRSGEEEFVHGCEEQYDLIMSDADHLHAHEWFGQVYDRLLAPGGILVYHDVRQYPGLAEIVSECERLGLRHVVFDKCSRAGEACQRGLLCIFKEA